MKKQAIEHTRLLALSLLAGEDMYGYHMIVELARREFMDRVLLPLGRLTAEERENVRRELEEHVEDRMEALLGMGWSAELAEERCLEAMGDPAEIGRAHV